MTIIGRVVLCGVAVFGAIALSGCATDEMAQKAINKPSDSWGIWGPAKVDKVSDSSVPGGTARRVTISPKPAHAWDVGAYILITKPVKKGDVLQLAFWARAVKIPAGNDFILLSGRIYGSGSANTSVTPQTEFLVGRQWKLYYASGKADKDYPVGKLSCGMVLGTGDQTVDFGPAYIVDYGPGYDLSKLPHD